MLIIASCSSPQKKKKVNETVQIVEPQKTIKKMGSKKQTTAVPQLTRNTKHSKDNAHQINNNKKTKTEKILPKSDNLQNAAEVAHGDNAYEKGCSSCHKIQKDIGNSTGGLEVEIDMSSICDMEDCTNCHDDDYGYKFNKEECINCHEERYLKTLMEWQTETLTKLKLFKITISDLENKLEHPDNKVQSEAKELLHKSKQSINFIEKDNSKGAHNIDYVRKIFKVVDEKISRAKKILNLNQDSNDLEGYKQ